MGEGLDWLVVKELKLSYYNKECLLCTIDLQGLGLGLEARVAGDVRILVVAPHEVSQEECEGGA